MAQTTQIARRTFLAAAAGAGFSPWALAAEPVRVWLSPTRPSMWNRENGHPIGNSQVGMPARVEFVYTGAGGLGVSPVTSDAGARLHKSGLINDIRFDNDLAQLLGPQVLASAKHFALQRTDDKEGAHLRILPQVILRPWDGPDDARLEVLLPTEVKVAGVTSFEWTCSIETADVAPLYGPGSWTERGGELLHERFKLHALPGLRTILTELELRQNGLWKDPVDPAKLLIIRLKHWPENVWRAYAQLGETETHLMLASVRTADMGHLFNFRRYVFDKRMIAKLDRRG